MIEKGREKVCQPFGLEKPALQSIEDSCVKFLHANGLTRASGFTAGSAARAGVIAILPGFAGADGERASTVLAAALGKANQ
jgi:hypothetical protein